MRIELDKIECEYLGGKARKMVDADRGYSNFRNAWALARLKESALYFEKIHILGDYLVADQDDLAALRKLPQTQHGVNSLNFETFAPGVFVVGSWMTSMQEAGLRKWCELQGKDYPEPPLDKDHPYYELGKAIWVHRLAVHCGLTGGGALVYPNLGAVDDPTADPSFALTQIRLIDVSTLSWEHILEIRADEESAKKLRRLRLFLCDRYDGWEVERIKDDLLQRLDDYEETAHRMGANLREGSIGMLLGTLGDIKVGPPLAIVSLVAAYFGLPAGAVLTAAAPFVFQLGKVGIDIRKQRREFASGIANNEVAFLHEIKSASQARSKGAMHTLP
jgi:hypothetical protein